MGCNSLLTTIARFRFSKITKHMWRWRTIISCIVILMSFQVISSILRTLRLTWWRTANFRYNFFAIKNKIIDRKKFTNTIYKKTENSAQRCTLHDYKTSLAVWQVQRHLEKYINAFAYHFSIILRCLEAPWHCLYWSLNSCVLEITELQKVIWSVRYFLHLVLPHYCKVLLVFGESVVLVSNYSACP